MRSKSKASTSLRRPNFAGVRLHIEYVHTSRIWAPRRQTRGHKQTQVRELAGSIEKNGFNVPLLVDHDLGLISGHARLDAAKMVELERVPVIRIEHLTDEQIRLFSIFDNRIAEASEWDDEALNLEFEELRIAEPTLDLTDSGFHIAEIDALAGRSRTAALDDLDVPAEPKANAPTISRLGDIWTCGRHRVICGDATDPAAMAILMGERPARILLTDPPYDLPTRFFSSSGKHGNFVAGAGELGSEGFERFLTAFIGAAQPVLVDGALLYIWMDWRHIGQLLAAGEAAKLTYKQLLVWVKPSSGMGSFYRSGHELVGIFQHGEGRATNNIMLGKYGRNRSNVLQYPGVRSMRGGKKAMELHPSVKNVACIADLLLDASAPGEAVLDCFGGSGTTLIAAEKTDRVAYLCELSPPYVDTIVRRFDDLKGEKAVLASTGQSFEEVAAERLNTAGEI